MQMMGTLVFLIISIIAVIPPRSPLLIPSTSSIIISVLCIYFYFCGPIINDKLFLPYFISSTLFLLRASLALYSTIEYPNYLATKRAAVVLPRPASPLSSAAFEFIVPDGINELNVGFTSLLFPFMWISSHILSHSNKSLTWAFCPIIYEH